MRAGRIRADLKVILVPPVWPTSPPIRAVQSKNSWKHQMLMDREHILTLWIPIFESEPWGWAKPSQEAMNPSRDPSFRVKIRWWEYVHQYMLGLDQTRGLLGLMNTKFSKYSKKWVYTHWIGSARFLWMTPINKNWNQMLLLHVSIVGNIISRAR